MDQKTKINDTVSWQEITPGGGISASGNSSEFHTGDWRTLKPVFHGDKCIRCLLCAPVCPDCSIPVAESKRGDFDYDFCKGCGVCANVCPVKAITMTEDQK